jgi:hypothetical protein
MIRVLAALAVVGVIAGGCASQPAAPRVATPAAPAPGPPAPFSDRELADELARQGVGVPKDAPTTPPRPGEDIPTEIRQTPRGVVVTFRYVLFAFDSDALTPQARREIERMAFVLNHPQAATRRVTLEGHTDAIGTEAYNLDLSRRRAEVERLSTRDHRLGERECLLTREAAEVHGHAERSELIIGHVATCVTENELAHLVGAQLLRHVCMPGLQRQSALMITAIDEDGQSGLHSRDAAPCLPERACFAVRR